MLNTRCECSYNYEASRKLHSHQSCKAQTTHVHWTHKYLDITFQSFFIQNLIKVSHSHFFSLEVAEIQAWRSEFNGSTWALSMTGNFFFLLFPSNLITSSTLLLFFPVLTSQIWNFVSLSLLLSLSSSVFLSSQANYLPASQSLIFGLP